MDDQAFKNYVTTHIKKAVKQHQLEVYYQPIIRTMTKDVTAFSCYIRYHDPHYGLLMPKDFLPYLEEEKLISIVDLFVFEDLCKKIKAQRTRESQVRFLMTMSQNDFEDETFLENIKTLLNTYQVSATMIRLYLKECEMIDRQGHFYPYIIELMDLGFTFWLTEYSRISLKYRVLTHPKICGADLTPFMVNDDDPITRAGNQAVIIMNHKSHSQTLAIGVEDQETAERLSSFGCERLAGNYFMEPLPYEECLVKMEEKGLSFEDVHYTTYYDQAEATIDFHDGSAFSIIEYDGLYLKFLMANKEFMGVLTFLGPTSLENCEEICNGANSKVARFMHTYFDRIVNGSTQQLNISEEFGVVNMQFSFVSKNKGHYILKMIIKMIRQDDGNAYLLTSKKIMDSIYRTYDMFSLIDLSRQIVTMTSINEQTGLLEYSEYDLEEEIGRYQSLYIHPDDQKRYLEFFNLRTLMARIYETGNQKIHEVFRMKKGDCYKWVILTLQYVNEEQRDLLLAYTYEVAPETFGNLKMRMNKNVPENKKVITKISRFEVSLEELLMKMSEYAHDYDDRHRNFTVAIMRLPSAEDYVVEHKDVSPYMYKETLIHIMQEALEPLSLDFDNEKTYVTSLEDGRYMLLTNIQNIGLVDLVLSRLRIELENSKEIKGYDENYEVPFYAVHASDLKSHYMNTYLQMLENVFSVHDQTTFSKSEKLFNFSSLLADEKTVRTVVNRVPFGIILVNHEHQIALWNTTAEQLTGFSADMMLGHQIERFSSRFYTQLKNSQIIDVLDPLKNSMTGFFKVREGYRVEITLEVISLRDRQERMTGSLIIFNRINNLEFSEKTIQSLYDAAVTDPLTKLPRRNYVKNFLGGCIASAHATNKEYAILFTDLNGFGNFNNTYGHEAGDLVLEAFGKTLLKKTRTSDCIGRWGGDEFIAILTLDQSPPDSLMLIAKRYQEIGQSIQVTYHDIPLNIELSIGITKLRKDDNIEKVINRADSYMYVAKRHTKHHIVTDDNCDQYEKVLLDVKEEK